MPEQTNNRAEQFTEPGQRRWSLVLKVMAEEVDRLVRAFDIGTADEYGKACIAFDNKLSAELDRVAASVPASNHLTQEASLVDNATFRKGIRDDGTVEGYAVETHYLPCKGVGDDAGFLRVLVDDNATDVETRVPHSALLASGWIKAAAPALPITPAAEQKDGEGAQPSEPSNG